MRARCGLGDGVAHRVEPKQTRPGTERDGAAAGRDGRRGRATRATLAVFLRREAGGAGGKTDDLPQSNRSERSQMEPTLIGAGERRRGQEHALCRRLGPREQPTARGGRRRVARLSLERARPQRRHTGLA